MLPSGTASASSDDHRLAARAAGWREARAYADRLLVPSFGRPGTAVQPALHPSRDVLAATADVRESLSGHGKTVITLFESGSWTFVREGRLPRWSPDGSVLAHLCDDGVWIGETKHVLPGMPERLAWNAAGTQLLVVVAESGSQLSNIAGSGLLAEQDELAWLPTIESTLRHLHWRRLVIIDAATGIHRVVGSSTLNVWDACWAGPAVLAVCSDGSPSESAWYTADLRLIDGVDGSSRVVARPAAQVGAIAASPSGRRAAYVESIASDRDIVAGDLQLLDLAQGTADTQLAGFDVSDLRFLDESTVGFAGLNGLQSRIGILDLASGSATTLWESTEHSTTGINPTASFRDDGDVAFIRAGFRLPPEAVLLSAMQAPSVLVSLAHEGSAVVTGDQRTSQVITWSAPDGQQIEGWLHLPSTGADSAGRHPLVVWVHGGPMWSHRSGYAVPSFTLAYLLAWGYAVLLPNPRGSTGRGQAFASAVVGDMGGADAQDLLSGVTHLIEQGIADPARIGVTGGSYGGFMSAWLVTQTDVFAAAVAQFPITDWGIQHGVSSIPFWDELFLDGKPYALDGDYIERAPLTHAARVSTPTLFIGGGQDRATPAGQALSMHRALAAHGVDSECVIYPNEGHGCKEMPAVIDSTARIIDWFQRYMPAKQ